MSETIQEWRDPQQNRLQEAAIKSLKRTVSPKEQPHSRAVRCKHAFDKIANDITSIYLYIRNRTIAGLTVAAISLIGVSTIPEIENSIVGYIYTAVESKPNPTSKQAVAISLRPQSRP